MIKETKSVEISLSAPEFKDCFVVLRLMNSLVTSVNNLRLAEFRKNLGREESEKYHYVPSPELPFSCEECLKIYETLKASGYVATEELIEPSVQYLRLRK